MDPHYEATRLIDITRSMQLAARSAERERWPREQLIHFQQEQAAARSGRQPARCRHLDSGG